MVLCECVLSLCSDPLNVLKEMRRVLLPQGSLVLMDIYAQTPKSKGWALRGLNVRCCLQGAVDRTAVENRVAAAGFELLLWEDHTRLLKQLAAQLVWTYGSLDAFWSAVAGPDTAETLCRRGGAGGSARPGYYLLVARKPKNK
jgi:SAM-dependent methyltransferase